MSILDAALHVGKETTYGTAVTPTRSFEAQADSWKREQQRLESVGFRAGMQTVRSDRVTTINMGGAGSLEVDFLTKGMGLLLQGALGSATAPVQQASTAAYKATFQSTADAPTESFTIQMVRPYAATDSSLPFTHKGCVFTGWKLTQEVGQLLKFSADFDCQDISTSDAAGTPTYPSGSAPFDWSQCVATIGGSAVDVRKFEFAADLAPKTDRRYLRGNALKKQPVRGALPTYSGTIELDFDSSTRYDEWVAGSNVALVVTWTGALIATSYYYSVVLTLPAVQWTGDSPSASLSDLPTQPLPFKVHHDGTNPAVKLEVTSTDTSF